MARASAERVNVNLPKPLLDDLRKYVPRSQRSEMIARATAREIRRIKLNAILSQLFREPAWRSTDHPDLTEGANIDHYMTSKRRTWGTAGGKRESRRG